VTTQSAAKASTQVVLLTPEGRAAVATLLVEGPRANALVGELFHPANGRPLAKQPLLKILFGRWQSSQTGEELIVCRRDEMRIEIHCHGGRAAAGAIVDSLVERGCRASDWRQWVRESTPDPIRAAAHVALASATTERAAAILWDQASGALRRALDEIAALVAARDVPQSLARIDALAEYAALGQHLVKPWQVVLAGRPNVGKSSLINSLVGYQRAIVHATPGTTRDVVTAAAAIDGWPVELADTAGLRASADPLEAAGIQLARDHLAAADLVVLVFDASRPWSSDDETLAGAWPRAVCVHNKCDLLGPHQRSAARRGGLVTSALGGEGIDQLERAIGGRLVPQAPAAGAAVPFLAGQVAALARVREAVQSGEWAAANGLLARADAWSGQPC
jgi:tRNA modification GTPase